MADSIEDDPKTIEQALRSIEGKLSRLADVVGETGNATLLAKIKELEVQRNELQHDLAAAADRTRIKAGMRSITAKQVQAMLEFAPVSAEGADMCDGESDIVGRQRVTEGRHVTIEAAHRAAFVDHGEPIGIRLATGKGTVREIRQRHIEAHHGAGRALAVGSMTGGAPGAVHVFGGAAGWKWSDDAVWRRLLPRRRRYRSDEDQRDSEQRTDQAWRLHRGMRCIRRA